MFRAPASRRGNSLGIEAWILKIRALLNPRLDAQCGQRLGLMACIMHICDVIVLSADGFRSRDVWED